MNELFDSDSQGRVRKMKQKEEEFELLNSIVNVVAVVVDDEVVADVAAVAVLFDVIVAVV